MCEMSPLPFFKLCKTEISWLGYQRLEINEQKIVTIRKYFVSYWLYIWEAIRWRCILLECMLQACSKCQVSQYFDNWTRERCSKCLNMFKQSNLPKFRHFRQLDQDKLLHFEILIISVATNDQHIFDRTKMRAKVLTDF